MIERDPEIVSHLAASAADIEVADFLSCDDSDEAQPRSLVWDGTEPAGEFLMRFMDADVAFDRNGNPDTPIGGADEATFSLLVAAAANAGFSILEGELFAYMTLMVAEGHCSSVVPVTQDDGSVRDELVLSVNYMPSDLSYIECGCDEAECQVDYSNDDDSIFDLDDDDDDLYELVLDDSEGFDIEHLHEDVEDRMIDVLDGVTPTDLADDLELMGDELALGNIPDDLSGL